MEGLIILGLFFLFLALIWAVYLAPKASRERQEEFMRRLEKAEESHGDTPADLAGEEDDQEK